MPVQYGNLSGLQLQFQCTSCCSRQSCQGSQRDLMLAPESGVPSRMPTVLVRRVPWAHWLTTGMRTMRLRKGVPS